MTTASKITLARICLIPVYMILLYCSGGAAGPWMWAALGVFILASLTDFVDGYIARHCNQVSDFGKFLDPLADKLLVLSCMCVFTQWGIFPAWALMVVLARELAVTGLRLTAVGRGRVIAAGWSGKVKTFSTMVGLCVWMAFPGPKEIRWIVTGIILLTTVVSGIEYFVRNWDCLAQVKEG